MSAQTLRPPRDLEQVAARLASSSSPALIQYDAAGQRLELSGRVFENWSAKTANLLTDECEVEPGDLLSLEGPRHWRLIALAFGAARAGCRLRAVHDAEVDAEAVSTAESAPGATGTAPEDGAREIWAGLSPSPAADRAETGLLVARQALALRYDGPEFHHGGAWPEHLLDFAEEVRSHGDLYLPLEPAEAASGIMAAAVAQPSLPEGRGAWVEPTGRWTDPEEQLWRILGGLLTGTALVLLPEEILEDPARREEILEQERAVLR